MDDEKLEHSFRDQGKTLGEFGHEFFVKCPQCGKFAYIKSSRETDSLHPIYKNKVLSCDSCGFLKIYHQSNLSIGSDFQLWLQAQCCGHTLWAYNLAHLVYIESYISAALRLDFVNEIGYKNTSMLTRLPFWMKDRTHREEICRCIRRMKATIPPKYQNDSGLSE